MAAAPAQHIGRYEVLGHLGAGGMAEVLLARQRGPHGFERAVVIKRILPHLAADKELVELFLDEARIIANLRHPNLIQVLELGSDENGPYLVMEYLEGESLAGLCRRLALRDEELPPGLAAHIVAEACAGLHAAHETTTPDGQALELVHRDISPENIFVTYAGAVHVIDFGIAATTTRVSRTETGMVRGKVEYLAPEQVRGEPLDRRTDVFALGIVLFETASGRRAYRRPNHAQAMMAIVSEPAPRLAVVQPGAPAALDAICARALSKEPSDRFQTAADMRRELIAYIRRQTIEDGGERLARLMKELFADRITEKTELLRRVRVGDAVAQIPPTEVDAAYADTVLLGDGAAPSGSAVESGSATTARPVMQARTPPSPSQQTLATPYDRASGKEAARRRIPGLLLGAALFALVALLATSVTLLRSSRANAVQPPQAAPLPESAQAPKSEVSAAIALASPPPLPPPTSQAVDPVVVDAGAPVASAPRPRTPSRTPASTKPAASHGMSPSLW
jgi:eukaryotic-like serine/threonine-protein kinase